MKLLLTFILIFTMSAFAQVEAAASFDLVGLLLKAPFVIGQIVIALSAVLAIASVIPGNQPDKFLKSAIDLLKKFSRK